VPPDDPDSNFRMANQTLLSKLSLSDDQIHPMGCDQDPERSAAHYEQLLRQFFKGAQPRFDLILLGLGSEGHTASLFPGSHLLHEQERWVAAEFVEAKEAWRCTLTPPALNAARTVVFLVQGEAKAEAVLQVIKGDHQPDQWPAQIIEPTEGELHWFMDEAAAGLL
jgi:6-phosphogluconolactonase